MKRDEEEEETKVAGEEHSRTCLRACRRIKETAVYERTGMCGQLRGHVRMRNWKKFKDMFVRGFFISLK